jgi:hypothetical protein
MSKALRITGISLAITMFAMMGLFALSFILFAFTFCSAYDRQETIAIAASNLERPYQVSFYNAPVGTQDGYYYFNGVHQINIRRQKGCSLEVQTIFHEFAHAEQYENSELTIAINEEYPTLPKEARAELMAYKQMKKSGYSWCAFNLFLRQSLGLRTGEYNARSAIWEM